MQCHSVQSTVWLSFTQSPLQWATNINYICTNQMNHTSRMSAYNCLPDIAHRLLVLYNLISFLPLLVPGKTSCKYRDIKELWDDITSSWHGAFYTMQSYALWKKKCCQIVKRMSSLLWSYQVGRGDNLVTKAAQCAL